MIIRLSHPARETAQCVVSERDARWLETQGWVRIPTAAATAAVTVADGQAEALPTVEVKIEAPQAQPQARPVVIAKQKRPYVRRKVNNGTVDIR